MQTLHRILDVVADRLDQFSFRPGFQQDRYKRFSELAIFMHYIRYDADLMETSSYRKIEDFLYEALCSLTGDEIFYNSYTAYHIVMPYAFMRHCFQIPELEHANMIIADESLLSPEVPPHRALEWNLFCEKSGAYYACHEVERGILGHRMQLRDMDRDLAYALTHALFYALDFGFAQLPPRSIDVDGVLVQLGGLVARFCAEGDIDVALECLIGIVALARHAHNRARANLIIRSAHAGLEKLLERSNFLAMDVLHHDDQELGERYHSLLVLGILGVLVKHTYQQAILPPEIPATWFYHRSQPTSDYPELHEQYGCVLEDWWNVVASLNVKGFGSATYDTYFRKYGRCGVLESLLCSAYQRAQRRNRAGMYWTREFALLAVPDDEQRKLEQESDAAFEAAIHALA